MDFFLCDFHLWSTFKKSPHLGFGVFIDIWSMPATMAARVWKIMRLTTTAWILTAK
jgi:hypothetical protein